MNPEMDPDEDFGRRLSADLTRHRPELPDELGSTSLADRAMGRAGAIRRRRQAGAGLLAVALLAGVGVGVTRMGRPEQVQPAAGSASPSTSASAAACTEQNATWSFEKQGTVDGIQTWRVLVRPNAGRCAVQGRPGVWFVDANQRVVGSPAQQTGSTPQRVVATWQHPAVATLRMDTTRLQQSDCKPVTATMMQVYAPGGTVPMGNAVSVRVCSNASIPMLTISPFTR